MGLEQLTGTPWHVERFTRKEGDEKRHRSRCVYYRGGGYCAWHFEHCWGSSHCRHYDEVEAKEEKNKVSSKKEKERKLAEELKASQETKRVLAEERARIVMEYEKKYSAGSVIGHKTYGYGIITETKDGKITVRFKGEKVVILSIETCINNHLIWFVK